MNTDFNFGRNEFFDVMLTGLQYHPKYRDYTLREVQADSREVQAVVFKQDMSSIINGEYLGQEVESRLITIPINKVEDSYGDCMGIGISHENKEIYISRST